MFINIPQTAILAHYTQIAPNKYAVVTSRGVVLGPSFYDIRHKYTGIATIAGAGCWVIMLPKPQPTQPTLF